MEGKKVVEKINTEDLIHEVEKHPAVWDSSTDQYSNKNEKRNAWSEIITHFIPDFEGKSTAERNEIANNVQKKWKGIRACYTRELMKKKNDKSGSGVRGRKQYVYFETLRFLEAVCKPTGTSKETPREAEETERRSKHSRMKKNSDDELIQALKSKILRENQQPPDETNEDRLFLLSLVSELQKVPADRKLQVKSQILTTIAQAQQVYQQLPQYQYPTLLVYHPTHAQQPTFHGGQYSHNNPMSSGSVHVPSPTPASSPSSPTFSEDSSVNVDLIDFEQ